MVIFHSYVSLPEGKPSFFLWFSDGFWVIFSWTIHPHPALDFLVFRPAGCQNFPWLSLGALLLLTPGIFQKGRSSPFLPCCLYYIHIYVYVYICIYYVYIMYILCIYYLYVMCILCIYYVYYVYYIYMYNIIYIIHVYIYVLIYIIIIVIIIIIIILIIIYIKIYYYYSCCRESYSW